MTPVIDEEGKSVSSYNKRSSLRRSGRLSGATTPASSPLSVSLSRQLTTEAADSIPHNKSVNEVEIEHNTNYTEVSGNWLIYYLIYWVLLISRLINWLIGRSIDLLMLNWAAKRFLQGWNATSSIDDNNNNLVICPVEVRWWALFLLSFAGNIHLIIIHHFIVFMLGFSRIWNNGLGLLISFVEQHCKWIKWKFPSH